MSIPLLSYSIYIISIYITLIYLLRSFSSEWMCVYFFKSCIQFTHANQKPFRRSSQVGFWQHTNCLGDEEGATLRLTRDPPPPWTNERTTRSQWTELRQLCFITICRWKRKISRIYINNLRVAGEGDFHLSPLFFFFFSFFFLFRYITLRLFLSIKKKKRNRIESGNRSPKQNEPTPLLPGHYLHDQTLCVCSKLSLTQLQKFIT